MVLRIYIYLREREDIELYDVWDWFQNSKGGGAAGRGAGQADPLRDLILTAAG